MAIDCVESRSDDESSAAPSDADEEVRVEPSRESIMGEKLPESIPEEVASTEETEISEDTMESERTEVPTDDANKAKDVKDVNAAPSDEYYVEGDADDNADAEKDAGGGDVIVVEGTESSFAKNQWEKAAAALRSNPSLMTSSILNLALHNRPPLHIVEFMLKINPDAAGVPRSGPSALQVAVRNHASVEVVEAVIRACPYALFTGNGSYDPLTYAKIWRREDEDLISLLERPISDWIKPAQSPPLGEASTEAAGTSQSPPTDGKVSRLSKEERRELSNVKLITAAIVRAQKKQIADAAEERREMEAELRALENREAKARRDLVQVFDDRVKKSSKANLVALDMKEKAFEARVASIGRDVSSLLTATVERQERLDKAREVRDEEARKTVEGAISSMRDDILAAADRVEKATTSYGARLADMAVRVDRESVISAAFRADTRRRQDALEERVENTIAGSFVYHPSPLPSLEVESIKGSGSRDPLFPDDEDFVDSTCIMGGSEDDGDDSFPFEGYKHNSFSSDWNSRAGDSKSDSSCWKASNINTGKTKKGTSRWRRWCLKLRK